MSDTNLNDLYVLPYELFLPLYKVGSITISILDMKKYKSHINLKPGLNTDNLKLDFILLEPFLYHC